MRRKKNKKKLTLIRNIIFLILICTLVYSGSKIFKWYKENKNSNKIVEEINRAVVEKENEEDQYKVDFNMLKEQNDETVAWLKVNGTNIEYPVVKTTDNSFYLTHSFDKSNNSAGWIFVDCRNKIDGTDKNMVIYGHNRRDGSMFGSLKNVLDANWYENEENRNIIFCTAEGESVYKVFAIYQIEAEEYYITTDFQDDAQFEEFVTNIKKRSVKEFGEDVSKGDTILTLSTCANNNKYRVVVHAKKI